MGFLSGVVGSFIYIEGNSLLTDAISHAALPGIAYMFLLTQTTNTATLLFGGAISACFAAWLIQYVEKNTRLKKDAILGVTLSVFFGFGIAIISLVQKYNLANQAIVHRFLFGSAATLLKDDIKIIGYIACIVLSILFLLWKEWQIVLFDNMFAYIQGYHVAYWRILLLCLTVLTILAGLQMVGVVLISSFFVAPAAIARQITSRFSLMAICAGFLGMLAGGIGAALSCIGNHVPTGPTIVIILTSTFFIVCVSRYMHVLIKRQV